MLRSCLLYFVSALLFSACQSPILAPDAELKLLADGFTFTEGPAKSPEGDIYFTDQPNDQILKWNIDSQTLSVFKKGAGRSNGLYFDAEGYLLACADEHNELWRFDMTGKHTVLLKGYDGQWFNGPNDLWLDDQGGIYFTDPLYKRSWWTHRSDSMYQDGMHVYYRSPEGELSLLINDFVRPNGIIGDMENQALYVADIGAQKTWKYRIESPGVLSHKTLFAPMGSDGMTIDKKRNIYLTGQGGVTVFDRRGKQVAFIAIPQKRASNVTIGGKDNKTLYITAFSAFYAIDLAQEGLY